MAIKPSGKLRTTATDCNEVASRHYVYNVLILMIFNFRPLATAVSWYFMNTFILGTTDSTKDSVGNIQNFVLYAYCLLHTSLHCKGIHEHIFKNKTNCHAKKIST